jgi:pimeloyl-ACP methyl ester carboxylesterase
MWDSPIRTREWETYTIEGAVDTGAVRLYFGVMSQYNGTFYYDDFSLEIETEKGQWTTLFFADFSEIGDDWEKYIGKWQGMKIKGFSSEWWTESNGNGNKCLKVVGKNIPKYGTDSEAGNYAEVNGIELYYEIYGQGKELVVLHGNGGSIDNASTHYEELIKKYRVIAVDSRAQGKSTGSEEEITYELMASDVNALLEILDVDSAYIWGHSDGAITGLILAMDYPKRVKKLLAFGANIQPDSLALFQYSIDHNKKIFNESEDENEKKLIKMLLEHPNIPYPKLSSIQASVLIMAGDRDLIRPEHTLKLFQHIPNAQLCILPGSTHGAQWSNQKLYEVIMMEFFDKPFNMPDTRSWY